MAARLLLSLLPLCSLLAILPRSTFGQEKDGAVWVLDNTNFDSWLVAHQNDLRVAEFYAPWCGHCKKLEPEWSSAAAQLKQLKLPIQMAKMDANDDSNKPIAGRFGVSGFPTIKMFLPGETTETDYNGPREAAGIVKYLKTKLASNKPFKSMEEWQAIVKSNGGLFPQVVGVFTEKNQEFERYDTYAKKRSEQLCFSYMLQSDTEAAEFQAFLQQFNLDGTEQYVIVLKAPLLSNEKHEPAFQVLTEILTVKTVEAFVTQYASALVNYYHENTQWLLFEGSKPDTTHLITLFTPKLDAVKNPAGVKYIANRYRKIALNFPNFSFSIADAQENAQVLDNLGRTGKPSSLVAWGLGEKASKKFVMEEVPLAGAQQSTLRSEIISAWLTELQTGLHEEYIKSGPVVEGLDDGVKILVARNIEQELSKDEDFLIMFYAPWCGHCKKLHPTWHELGNKLVDTGITIASFDATANEVPPEFEVKGFPTIYWVSALNKGNPVAYQGGRELKDLLDYVKKNTSKKEVDAAKFKAEL